jgi:hypothetical protein
VSEKPAAHAVQMPPMAPGVQVMQLLEQIAHVPAKWLLVGPNKGDVKFRRRVRLKL